MARERRSRSSFWRKDSYLMHATERQRAILTILGKRGFIAFRDLETHIEGSPATLRRDLERMANEGPIERVRGGAKTLARERSSPEAHPSGVPFSQKTSRNRNQKKASGRRAPPPCTPTPPLIYPHPLSTT